MGSGSGWLVVRGRIGEAEKSGFYPFSENPQEENPPRGYIVSANFQPVPANGRPVPGYYNLPDRGQRLDQRLADASVKWDLQNSQALQLDTATGYGPRMLQPLLPILRKVVATPEETALVDRLAAIKAARDIYQNVDAAVLLGQRCVGARHSLFVGQVERYAA